MALDKNRLGDAITARIQTENAADGMPAITGTSETFIRKYWRAIADEIIKEFLAHAEIEVTAFTAVATGVSTGTDVSGNITGTATGIIEA